MPAPNKPTPVTKEMMDMALLVSAGGDGPQRVAEYFGYNRRTIGRMKHRHPALAQAFEQGKRIKQSRCPTCGADKRKD